MSGAGILGASTAYQLAKEGARFYGALIKELELEGERETGGAPLAQLMLGRKTEVRLEELRLGESSNPIIRGHL
ncbi:hypothetical protein J41TS12_26260 [Paenibacillus antibioticophila]|uniref:FAD dependent oxidoreductase domain-containing protein n=1 Tax=Paenibacillus antibioticophila TaxID=1274374 RepID=A0A920CFL2_9BACL|nr:hypothetical protein J41TS12_26260 [Paenibacillus antibioticophila]